MLLLLYCISLLHLYFKMYHSQQQQQLIQIEHPHSILSLNIPKNTTFPSIEEMEHSILQWKQALQRKQYTFAPNRPIRLAAHVGQEYFDFWYKPEVTSTCSIPCQVLVPSQQQDEELDAMVLHSGKDENPSLSNQKDVLFVKMRNEPELLFATRCSQKNVPCQTDITVSYRQESTIWSTYMYTPPIVTPYEEMSSHTNGSACSFISNCVSHRFYFVQRMMDVIPVLNYGVCLHNAETTLDKMSTLNKECKFSLAFENTMQKDYVTEKYWQHYMVPQTRKSLIVYRGASLFLKQFWRDLPKKTYLDTNDFGDDPIKVAKYLQYLNQNETAFEEYFEWKKDPNLIRLFQERLQSVYEASTILVPCKICLAVAEMKQSRHILKLMGVETKMSIEQFEHWKSVVLPKDASAELHSNLDLLYDMAFGRVWRPNNFASSWNSNYKKNY